jgi:hypothetical protein
MLLHLGSCWGLPLEPVVGLCQNSLPFLCIEKCQEDLLAVIPSGLMGLEYGF